ncbi:hypothetical protein [Acidocella sp.]|uniref:hypothetical protein n=1 Tax=Acidocella sp. TaxID=50710 RepID=UPI002F42C5BE
MVFHLTIVETSHVRLAPVLSFGVLFKLGFVTVSALMHWAIYSGLFLMFARTLRRGREPLITAMARRMHGDLSGELALYTRRVTIAWACFFAVQLVTSIALFCFAPLVVWSFFVNILDIPLVVAMFSAEYACRLRCLQNPPRHSLAVILNMVAEIRKPREETAISL